MSEKPIRILLLSNNPNLGSTARILQGWFPAAEKHGLHFFPVLPAKGELSDWLDSIDHPYLIDPMPLPDKKKPFTCIQSARRVSKWAKQNKVDLIHAHEHNIYPYTQVLKFFLKKPRLCYIRFALGQPFTSWAFKGKRAPDQLLWTSHTQQNDSIENVIDYIPKAKQQVLHLGLDLKHFGLRKEEREKVRAANGIENSNLLIGTASAIKPIKRIEDFLTALKRITEKHAHVKGIIAGGPVEGYEAYYASIQEQIQTLNLHDKLIMLGHLSDIEPFMQAIDLFVSTCEYETFGMSVLEAMACRTPVCAYEGGSVKEVVGEAGDIVPTGELDGLSEKIDAIVSDHDLHQQRAAAAYDRVLNEFDALASLKKLCNIYEKMLHS